MKHLKNSALFSATVFATLVCTQATALAGVRVLGSASYKASSVDNGAAADTKLEGYSLRLSGQYDLFEPLPGLSIYGAAGVGTEDLKEKVGGVETSFRPLFAGVEAGVNFSTLPLLRFQGFAGYDFGLSGEFETRNSAGNPPNLTADLDNYGSVNLGARALLTVAPFISVGAEAAWHSSNIKIKGDARTRDAAGYHIGAVAAFSF